MPAFIADTFIDGLAKLTTDEQPAAKAAVFDFQLRPEHPSFQYHRIRGSTDTWSARVSRDTRPCLQEVVQSAQRSRQR